MNSRRDKFFLDTNVLVYSFDSRSPAKRERALELIGEALESHLGIISYQVVQEFLNVATGKFAKPLSAAEAQLYLSRVLMPLCEVFPDSALYAQALSISEEAGLSFYDSLIVGSAVTAGCKTLWTEDLQHGGQLRGLRIRNPFRA
jgi:predicted nucleic acid-binding protein